jgi:membrane fusion protein, multidrug efflux system
MTSEADLQTAQINLGYTDIVAPIAGKIGRTALTKGNVVSPDSGVLTTIVSQDPMYVTFPVSQPNSCAQRRPAVRPMSKALRHKSDSRTDRYTTSWVRSILST